MVAFNGGKIHIPIPIKASTMPAPCSDVAAAMAIVSLLLSLLIPRHPEPGNETVFAKYTAAPAE